MMESEVVYVTSSAKRLGKPPKQQ